MISNMHTPENVRALRAEVDRPDRAVVEAAFQTIIRWTDDDPERDGLIDTHARVVRAFEEFFVGYGQDPVPTIIGRALPRASQCGTQHFFRMPVTAASSSITGNSPTRRFG
jgi:GTP cyclohydrolase I